MDFKKNLLIAATVGMFFSAGVGIKTMAEDYWNGHGHVQAINNDIDLLKERIGNKNKTIRDLYVNLGNVQSDLYDKKGQLDMLTNQLSQVNQEKNQLSNNNNTLNDQIAGKNNELQLKQQEIEAKIQEVQDKINEGNAKVLAKQAELNQANQTISTLSAQVSDLQSKLAIDDTALNDVKQARQKADQAVQKTGGEEQAPLTSTSSQNQLWEAKVYNANDRVSYNGKNYIAKWYASAQDMPGKAAQWKEYQEIK